VTHKAWRPQGREAHIDYMFTSSVFDGNSESFNGEPFYKSEHLPTKSSVSVNLHPFAFEAKPRSVVGWRPKSLKTDLDGTGTNCQEFERGVMNRLKQTGGASVDLKYPYVSRTNTKKQWQKPL